MARRKRVKNKNGKKCCNCKLRPAAPGRTWCNTCRSRIWVKKNPIDAVWHWLKKSAKKRGLEFTLEKEWFRDFIRKSDYMEGRGRLTDSLNIDRIRGDEGYTPNNVCIITKEENLWKYHHNDDLPAEHFELLEAVIEPDDPFC